MTEKATHVDALRINHGTALNSKRGFAGFANGLEEGDEITIEFWGEYYRVRVVSTRIVPNCVTPYVVMEIA